MQEGVDMFADKVAKMERKSTHAENHAVELLEADDEVKEFVEEELKDVKETLSCLRQDMSVESRSLMQTSSEVCAFLAQIAKDVMVLETDFRALLED